MRIRIQGNYKALMIHIWATEVLFLTAVLGNVAQSFPAHFGLGLQSGSGLLNADPYSFAAILT
jgi:hypothetical protein